MTKIWPSIPHFPGYVPAVVKFEPGAVRIPNEHSASTFHECSVVEEVERNIHYIVGPLSTSMDLCYKLLILTLILKALETCDCCSSINSRKRKTPVDLLGRLHQSAMTKFSICNVAYKFLIVLSYDAGGDLINQRSFKLHEIHSIYV